MFSAHLPNYMANDLAMNPAALHVPIYISKHNEKRVERLLSRKTVYKKKGLINAVFLDPKLLLNYPFQRLFSSSNFRDSYSFMRKELDLIRDSSFSSFSTMDS